MAKMQMLGLVALCALFACVTASHQDRLAGLPFSSNKQVCESCFWMQASVHAYGAQVATRARVDGSHPAVTLARSAALADDAVTQALVADVLSAPLSLMRNNTQAVCALGDACELVMAEQLAEDKFGVSGSVTNDDFGCPLCEFVMTNVKQTLASDPKLEEDLMAKAHTLCAALEPSVRTECDRYVEQYGRAAFKWVQDLDIQGACTMLGACHPANGASFPVIRQLLSQLAAAALLPAAANDNCDSCKMVVLEAAAMLKNPQTQLEIMNEAKQACQFFQQYQVQCVQYVDMYGPMVLQLAQQYMQPDLLCTQLGFCPVPTPPPAVIVQ